MKYIIFTLIIIVFTTIIAGYFYYSVENTKEIIDQKNPDKIDISTIKSIKVSNDVDLVTEYFVSRHIAQFYNFKKNTKKVAVDSFPKKYYTITINFKENKSTRWFYSENGFLWQTKQKDTIDQIIEKDKFLNYLLDKNIDICIVFKKDTKNSKAILEEILAKLPEINAVRTGSDSSRGKIYFYKTGDKYTITTSIKNLSIVKKKFYKNPLIHEVYQADYKILKD